MIKNTIGQLSLGVAFLLLAATSVLARQDTTARIPTREQVKAWLDRPLDEERGPAAQREMTIEQARVLSVLRGSQEVLERPDEHIAPIEEAAARDRDFAHRLYELYTRFIEGQLTTEVSAMVWRGQETRLAPFCAAIGHPSGDGFVLAGSGFLIAPNALVTAAHVAEKLEGAETIEVRFGPNFNQPECTATADPTKMVKHDKYQKIGKTDPSHHDIAVIILKESVDQPVACLPAEGDESSEGAMLVVGYGQVNSWAPLDGKKRASIATIIELPCTNGGQHCCVPGADIAAGGHDLGGDACKGDSGGPMVANDKSATLVIGMTIHGKCPLTTCPTTVGVYLRLLPYKQWLRGINAIEWSETTCP